MGPQFRRTTAMGASAIAQPLQVAPAWQHRFPATNAILEFTLISTVADTQFEVFSGSENLVQRSAVPGGGTIGVYRDFQNCKGAVGVYAGQEISINLYSVTACSVMLEIHLNPI